MGSAERTDGSRLLFCDLRFTSLDAAIDRFRAFAIAHTDMEPALRCERSRDGRRRWALNVYLRDNPRRITDDDTTPPV